MSHKGNNNINIMSSWKNILFFDLLVDTKVAPSITVSTTSLHSSFNLILFCSLLNAFINLGEFSAHVHATLFWRDVCSQKAQNTCSCSHTIRDHIVYKFSIHFLNVKNEIYDPMTPRWYNLQLISLLNLKITWRSYDESRQTSSTLA